MLGYDATGNGDLQAVQLSRDQTGDDPSEIARIRTEHPGEESTAVFRGRVLGNLQPSRSFGDARYKWDIKTSKLLFGNYYNREVPKHYLTPPYVTANPGITRRKLSPADKFLVLATDGLYDELDNDEIVALVAGWLRKRGKLPGKPDPLEVESSERKPTILPGSPRGNIRKWAYVDDNAATHLVRNALGGADNNELTHLLSIPSPHSRRFRDDITVTVVFLDDAMATSTQESTAQVQTIVIDKTGGVTVKEADGQAKIPKAKL